MIADVPPPHSASILIIGIEFGVASALADFLFAHDMMVECCTSADDGRIVFSHQSPDVVIVDQSICSGAQASLLGEFAAAVHRPGIIVSARFLIDADRVSALELGADDHVAASCHPREVLARVRALQRRRTVSMPHADRRQSSPSPDGLITVANGWSLRLGSRSLTAPTGTIVPVTRLELVILATLLRKPGETFTRSDLAQLTGHINSDEGYRAIDVVVSRLRAKLAKHGGAHVVATVRGVGYYFPGTMDVSPATVS